ncbi:hypothetical protein BDW02DRAFT_52709 [Decorospora gaudefroyi]|uniref:Heterokaryon incompatibility domain-containing protein n=1 Tax=Decorospora gaudefroyi TaxID=184978 RepID=A0A6A5KLZ7_9PLEO|nr:hypothetical protein BDW02DRAFT_52709 [Decorospora gaudefroyi]
MSDNHYQDLDHLKREIRILRFLSPTDERPDLVQCTMHHVSLDDMLPDYRDFLAEMGMESSAEATEKWLDAYPFYAHRLETEEARPRIAAWRHVNCGLPSEDSHPVVIDALSSLPHPSSATPITLSEFHPERTISISPRFAWGDFEAISYCWESDIRNTAVAVDGTIVRVPASLGALLQQIQHLPEARSAMGFWIDGLCINQNNVVEKNHQVGLMKCIYSRAFSVITWLGPGDFKSNRASKYICRLYDLYDGGASAAVVAETANSPAGSSNSPSGRASGVAGKCKLRRKVNGAYQRVLDVSLRDNIWEEILDIFSRSYWGRMWIIQEQALNRGLSFFMCGRWQIPQRAIEHACDSAMVHAGQIGGRILTHLVVRPDQAYVWNRAYNVSRICSLLPSDMVEKKLDLARKAKAKDPRDKIYGLLGLLPEYLTDYIEPDYSKTTDRVYVEFATQMLKASSRLDEVLGWCKYSETSDLPSWVPDWNTPFDRHHLQWFRNRQSSNGKSLNWSLSTNGLRLRCKGYRIDKILAASFTSKESLAYGLVAPLHPRAPSTSLGFGRYCGESVLENAVNRTLLHGHPLRHPTGHGLTELPWWDWLFFEDCYRLGAGNHPMYMSAQTSDDWTTFDRFRQTNAYFSVFGSPLKEFFPAVRSRVQKGSLCAEWCLNHQSRNINLFGVGIRGRRLITTHTGWLGLAPAEADVDDVVAILFGCNYPVVLRPCAEGYRYIGECYIDGLMDGEAIDIADREGYQEEDITIV